MDWHTATQQVESSVVRISSQHGTGTGFVLYRDDATIMVATAAHVISDAHLLHSTIGIANHAGAPVGKVHARDRKVIFHASLDSAIIRWNSPTKDAASLSGVWKSDALMLMEPGKGIRTGVEVGWLGFPHLVPKMCFFSGHVSTLYQGRYFIDGVAIHGVSGGPAFYYDDDDEKIVVIGTVSSYRPNKATGETLPGLMTVEAINARGLSLP